MWRPWGKNKSTVRIHSSASSPSQSQSQSQSQSTSPSSTLFSNSSFKDIQSLCIDDPPQIPPLSQHHQLLPSPTKKPSVYHRVRLANSLLRSWSTHSQLQTQNHHQQQQHHHHHQTLKLPRSLSHPIPDNDPTTSPISDPKTEPVPFIHGAEQRVVVYFTSLRVVRSTFEACMSALRILRGFRVNLDERDVSMDAAFITELNRVMDRVGMTLPRIFIGGKYIGGAEELSKLNETGDLKKLLEGLPKADPGVCHVCGGHRFVLCDECDGSRKVYTDKGGFRTCGNCNENGLLRCPSCLVAAPVLLSCS